MKQPTFFELLHAKWAEGKFLCVGLDPVPTKIPACCYTEGHFANRYLVHFCCDIVDATKDIVCAFKPNIAFFEYYGEAGWNALGRIISHTKAVAPDVPIILDAKRADINKSNAGYLNAMFNFGANAITVNPYLGGEALQMFLAREDIGVIVICRTSNEGGGEFQDLPVPHPVLNAHSTTEQRDMYGTLPLYQYVAWRVAHAWNKNGNCALVMGATYPAEMHAVRQLVGDVPFLIPGIGTQGGDLLQTLKYGRDSRGEGMMINSSSGIIFASMGDDFAQAARAAAVKLDGEIRQLQQQFKH